MWEENILQLVGCLPGMCKALGSNPNNTETGWRCACLWPQAFRDTGRKIWCSKSFSDTESSKPVWDLWDPFFKTKKQVNTTTTNSKLIGELIDKFFGPDMSLGCLEHDLLCTRQHLQLRKLHMWGWGGSKWGSIGWKWGRMSKLFEIPAHSHGPLAQNWQVPTYLQPLMEHGGAGGTASWSKHCQEGSGFWGACSLWFQSTKPSLGYRKIKICS